jgi:putative DNA primase/helicase
MADAKRKQEEEEKKNRAKARAKAAKIWESAAAAPADHAYLAKKGVGPHGLRLHCGELVVPLRDLAGVLHSLQFIAADGAKNYLFGGRVSGCHFMIGEPNGALCIVEGYATGASIFESTGHAVAIGFNAGNLPPVAKDLRGKFRDLRLVVCADDDIGTPGNPGMKHARAAAQAVGGFLAVPDFGERRPERVSDFNDLHHSAGLEAVRACIERAMPFERPVGDDDECPPDAPNGKASHKSQRSPFIMKPNGLYWRDPDGDDDELFLSGPFQILAETRDLEGSSWGLLLQWKDRDNRTQTWAMPKALLAGDGIDVRRALLDRGLAIASGTKPRNYLSNYLVSQRSDGRARAVATTGWHGSTFVFPDGAIGKPSGEQCFFQTEHACAHNYNARGSLHEWQENVARFAIGNSRIAFAISASVAAILIHECGFESGGFHLRGLSSIGKSTALLVAGSLWGGGETLGFLTSWRTTSNGLEGVAVVHNDALLCLDEISQVSAKEAGDIAYMLANGSGKNRAARNGALRKPAQWRLLFLSSGELSLADKIAEDLRGKRQTAGQEVRFVDIPADTSVHGLFENLHGLPSSQAFADHLRKTARQYYGTAARAFIAAIAGELADVADAVKKAANSFVEDHCPPEADFQVRRVAHRFGFVAAAGEAAIKACVLPWAPGEAAKAAKTCFDAWLAARGGVESAEIRSGISAIRDFVSAHGTSRFLAAWEPAATNAQGQVIAEKIINLAGYRGKVGESWDFYFTSGGWREACAGLDPTTIAKALAERGLLEREDAKHLAKKTSIPGVGRVRVYHVRATILEAGQ